jgi:hypothetical protein
LKISWAAVVRFTSAERSAFLIGLGASALTGALAEFDRETRRFSGFSGSGFMALLVVLRLALVLEGDGCSVTFLRR